MIKLIEWKNVYTVEIPKGIKVSESSGHITVEGKLGKVSRTFRDNYVKIEYDGKSVKVSITKENKYTKGISGTWASEIRKAIIGVQEGYQSTMKIDYTHFPTRVSVRGNQVVIENFLGERSQRTAEIIGQTKVAVKGDKVTINGVDKKDIGETAANIERATKIRGFDPRVFHSGRSPIQLFSEL